MNQNLSPQQFVPAKVLREQYRPGSHELYSENTGRPWFHEDHEENLRQHRAWKLSEAKRLKWEDEPPGPDNQTLVDHIRTHGFPDSVLLNDRRKEIVDGNHRLEAAYHIDPDYPVPVTTGVR